VTFLETLLVLLLAAILLLQVSRRLGLPYPAMLALAGVVVAFIPGAPTIRIDPATALVLFIAPVLLDASFDFPLGAAWRLWRPLVVLAVGAVLLTAAAVAWVGWAVAGLPVAAAVVLGAIVAPPDAAAATAVLGVVSLPRRTVAVLKGESLFNDATALLLFSAALTVQSTGGLTAGVALRLAAAAPGGVLLGIAVGLVMRRVGRLVSGTLGGSILQFVNTFLVWVVAEHLGLSAVLAVVACAMTIAHATDAGGSPRMRVHSYAVWATVVFLLNVLAFLLMGLQAHAIVAQLTPHRFREALVVVALVFATLVTVRFAAVMAWHLLATRFPRLRGDLPAPSFRQGVAVSWSGMRGLLTLATAFALPGDFPQRDLVVLTAFGVVLATLVVQGLTLTPLIRLLGLDQGEDPEREVADGRRALMEAALARLDGEDDKEAEELRDLYGLRRRGADDREAAARLDRRRRHALALVDAERDTLEKLRDGEKIGPDTYYLLQEEIDWRELTLLPEQERRIDEA
jgi:CPA1 family monovalent cation:H+ antiporter